jgi:hypothetical protein
MSSILDLSRMVLLENVGIINYDYFGLLHSHTLMKHQASLTPKLIRQRSMAKVNTKLLLYILYLTYVAVSQTPRLGRSNCGEDRRKL